MAAYNGVDPHATLSPSIKAYADSIEITDDGHFVFSGWAFHHAPGAARHVLPVRAVVFKPEHDDVPFEHAPVERFDKPSMRQYFGDATLIDAAFRCRVKAQAGGRVRFDMCASGDADDLCADWVTFMAYDVPKAVAAPSLALRTPSRVPTLIVVDDFYADPDAVRRYALSQQFVAHPKAHKGARTETVWRPDELRARFSTLLGGRQVRNWDVHRVNGCFQSCVAGDQLVYHWDSQQYAGIVYLTPSAPPSSGTALYRSRHNGLRRMPDDADDAQRIEDETFRGGYLDATQFERIDTIGNVYNRLVLWDARAIHAACDYFGTDVANGRLFHLFFFDLG